MIMHIYIYIYIYILLLLLLLLYIYQQHFYLFQQHIYLPPPKVNSLLTKQKFAYNKPMKTSFLTITIAPAPFLFSLHTLCGHSWVVLISILIDVPYLQNDVFYFEKGLNGQMPTT